MATLPVIDPTLEAADRALEADEWDGASRYPRPYLGASAIGKACDRALWLGFRWARPPRIAAPGLKAIADGHASEAVQAARLRLVEGLQLWTEDPDHPGQQIGFAILNGHFRGNLDGIIQGLKQSKDLHVWEHKAVNEKKQAKLAALVAADPYNALEQWDAVYFVQAQVYMAQMDIDRHYLTCSSPGCRSTVSVRTRRQPEVVEWALERAKRLIKMDSPPLKPSDNPEHFECRWCDYKPLCHGTREAPKVTCRTCGHSTPSVEEGAPPWRCELLDRNLDYAEQLAGCKAHMYHPHLLAHFADVVGYDELGSVRYRMKANGREFSNGYRGDDVPDGVFLSVEIRAASLACQDDDANLDWLDLIDSPDISEIRSRFGAEVKRVERSP